MNEEKTAKQGVASFPKMEEETLNFWNKNRIFEKSIEREPRDGDYVFYDGPPFATGTPHYGHIVGSIMKDSIPRYWTMKGKRVERKWGWDCHGLPIENIVEKELGSKSKKDLEEIGVEKFNELCRKRVLEYVDEWERVIPRLGRWADMKNSYKTMDKSFMESVWWVFKQLWDKDLIYNGFRSMHICPRCETTLSQSEVAEGYKDIKDLSAIAKFELIDEPGTFVLAWTTTPWTLIGNVALAVGEKISYSVVKCEDKKYIVANELIEKIFDGKEYEILNNMNGKELVGKSYQPLFPYYAEQESLENKENGWKIYHGDFVSVEDGTGVVHIAPAFGDDDMKLGKEHNLPFIQHVRMDGSIKAEVTDFAGLNVKPKGEDGEKDPHMKTDIEIIKYLAGHETLFHKEKYEHSYPHCWRCDTPLLSYATSSWFVNVTKIKEDLLKNAKDINWSPNHIKEGRWGQWLEGARDWSVSRQRFWASVMPIWECSSHNAQHVTHNEKFPSSDKGCGFVKVFGDAGELEKLSGKKIDDLHKDVVDKITFLCEKCGGTMKRISDVLDTWFDSGSMPFAQMHYPFENKEKFEANFPAEFIAEGQDQCRAWFYYLHVVAGGVKNSRAFNNVIVNGIVQAEDGKKMSKKLQNYPDPMLVANKYGADAMRYYLLTSSIMLAENLNFSEKGVNEALRKVVMLLWNVYSFYEMFDESKVCKVHKVESKEAESENVLDKWIVARLNQLISEVTRYMDDYNLPKAARPIESFIDDLSTWYIRRSRDRFKGDDEDDKKYALQTTAHVLVELSKVMAPFTPFIAETIWQKVTGSEFKDENKSVHLEEWPSCAEASEGRPSDIEQKELEKMGSVKKFVELGLAKRDAEKIKVRQPLAELIIKADGIEEHSAIIGDDRYIDLIKDEVNVKKVTFKNDSQYNVEVVELDTVLTEELKLEGMKREIVRLINAQRKNAGLTISDKISLEYNTEDKSIKTTIERFVDEIKKETLTTAISFKEELPEAVELKVNGSPLFLKIIE